MLWLKVGLIGFFVLLGISWGVQRYRRYINSDSTGNDYQ
jgi:hypothetical protein